MSDCTGCRVCEYVCPKDAIRMIQNSRGFKYPAINQEKCIECGLCRARCPQNLNQFNTTIEAKGAYINDEVIREDSSSGGIFWSLVRYIMEEKGVVFGVRYDDNWRILYDFGETESECEPFRISKYAEADNEGLIQKIQSKLEEGRKVLFTGTPCQVAGVKSGLRKDYDNLILVDLVCNSVPSHKVWDLYIKEIEKEYGRIISINLRKKLKSWELSSYQFITDHGSFQDRVKKESRLINSYRVLFGNHYSTRPSCFECKYRLLDKRVSDITIGDFWNIDKTVSGRNDHRGSSIVLLNSQKGRAVFDSLENITTFNVGMDKLEQNNVLPKKNLKKPNDYNRFWKILDTKDYRRAAKPFTYLGISNYIRHKIGMIFKPILRR